MPELVPYQRYAAWWARRRAKSIVALDMGLGKSAISLHAAEPPVLILSPASVIANWQREVLKWQHSSGIGPGDVEIRSYADNMLEQLANGPCLWRTAIVDESHYAKMPDAHRALQTGRIVRRVPRAMLLSGTPVPNRPAELWTSLYSIGATKMSRHQFAWRYCAAFYELDYVDGELCYELNDRGHSNLPELRELLGHHMLRWTKQQVLGDALPPKRWRIIPLQVPLPAAEVEAQVKLEAELGAAWRARLKIGAARGDPLPVDPVLRREHGEAKAPAVAAHIARVLQETSKVVVFAFHRNVMDRLGEALAPFGVVDVRGGQSLRTRQEGVDAFQRSGGPRVLIGQHTAAGVGINLTAAHRVLFAEPDWAPATLNQAADRCHRIGQQHPVTADVLVIPGSIDEVLMEVVLDKIRVIDEIVWTSPLPSARQLELLFSA